MPEADYTMLGFYEIPAALSARDRARRANVLPLNLGPHGSNFEDVVGAIQALVPLDQGYPVEINGEMANLCVFSLYFLGDMPQQTENSGFKTSRAIKGCRFCHIDENECDNLDFDLVHNGIFHHQTIGMRAEMNGLNSKLARNKYGTNWGLNPEPANPPLVQISPALDLILSRPAEPAHSEYGGISTPSHDTLIQAFLTKPASKEYNTHLRTFPFPPTWARLQSPLHHLKSYSLSDHARWSIIVPVLLRQWLKPHHVQPHFATAVLADGDHNAVDFVIGCYAAFAKSNSVLMGSQITQED